MRSECYIVMYPDTMCEVAEMAFRPLPQENGHMSWYIANVNVRVKFCMSALQLYGSHCSLMYFFTQVFLALRQHLDGVNCNTACNIQQTYASRMQHTLNKKKQSVNAHAVQLFL